MPAEPNAVKALFLAAMEKPTPAERAAFLDGDAKGDARMLKGDAKGDADSFST
jgi:hypothetical protein